MRHRAAIIAIALALALAPVGAIPSEPPPAPPNVPPDFSPDQQRRLAAGKVVKRSETFTNPDGTRSGRGVAYIVIRADPEAILGVILDYDHYVDFFPNVEESTLYEQDGDSVYKARFVLSALGGLVRVRYHCTHRVDRERLAVTWTLDDTRENDFRSTTGFWKIWPRADGTSLVAYSILVDSGMSIPRAVEKLGTGYGLTRVAAEMKERVESRSPPTESAD